MPEESGGDGVAAIEAAGAVVDLNGWLCGLVSGDGERATNGDSGLNGEVGVRPGVVHRVDDALLDPGAG